MGLRKRSARERIVCFLSGAKSPGPETRDSRLGFQFEQDYVYTPYSLREKLGSPYETLEKQLAEPAGRRPPGRIENHQQNLVSFAAEDTGLTTLDIPRR